MIERKSSADSEAHLLAEDVPILSQASPVEILSAIKTYCCSFYGSMLWDLGGEGASQVFNSWTTGVRLTWGVPRATRSYLVQQVLGSGLTSARVDILARFAGFFQSLRKSPSYEVAVMAGLAGRDIRTTTGKNLKLVEELTGLDPWVFGSGRVKQVQLWTSSYLCCTTFIFS